MPDQVSGMTCPRTRCESLALPDLRHPDHQVGIEREVVDLGVGDLCADAERGEDVWSVLHDLLLRIDVVLLALGLVPLVRASSSQASTWELLYILSLKSP